MARPRRPKRKERETATEETPEAIEPELVAEEMEAVEQEPKEIRGEETRQKLNIIRIGAIVLAVIVIIAIALLLRPGWTLPPGNETGNGGPNGHVNVTENETEANETEICDDDCLYTKATTEKQSKYCDWMANDTKQEECYAAIANYDIDACLKTENETVLEECIITHANATGNILLCEELVVDKALDCKRLFEPCYFYEGTALNSCLALKKGNPSYCENDDLCLINYSVEKDSLATCDAISLPAIKQACKSVLNPGPGGSCDDLDLVPQEEYCWELFAIYTGNKLMCSEITQETQYSLECYSYFAVEERDITICDSSGTLQLDSLWKCYTAYSVGTGDVTGCQRIHPLATTNQFTCFFEYGKKYGNPLACDMMNNPKFARTCYQGIILNNANLNYIYCSGVAQIEWKNKCYTESAKLRNDVSLCDFITTAPEKEICVNSYNIYISNSTASG